MRSSRCLLLAALLIALESCGSNDTAPQGSDSTIADLCAGAAVTVGDIATTTGCAFENQLNNVYRFGRASTPSKLYDADGRELAAATRSCEAWWQATDADGVTILVNGKSGEIRAHGMVHPSMPSTTLPRFVPAPITAH